MTSAGENAFPDQARVVVVGGGIVGCSVAYHLAKRGIEVVLLERHRLTSGSTFHAAGLVGQLRTSASITRLLGHSVALYESLEAETGLATGWKRCGGLRLACSADRLQELRRQATTARSFGLEMQMISPGEARDLWPLIEIHDLVGAAFVPSDGSASPSDITQALARGARQAGARIIQDVDVCAVVLRQGRVAGVETSRGSIACEIVVNCAGRWAREFGELAGVSVPVVPVQHQFLITQPIAGVTPDLPTLRDPDRLTYYKEEAGGLIMGGYEPNPIPCRPQRSTPEAFELLDSDFEHFEATSKLAQGRVPALADVGIRQLLNGAEAFTPDGHFILGEAPECRGFFVGAGFNAFGIAAGGGAGRMLAEWIEAGGPTDDLWPVDIRRFGPPHAKREWIESRTLELYAKHYTIAWPGEEHASARRFRRSPLYDRLQGAGACFGEKLGWERPNWFAGAGEIPQDDETFGRPDWWECVATEHRATREAAALFDESSFAKFEVEGPDAERALDFVCAGDLVTPPGKLTYTQCLNERGGIEADFTVSRLAADRFAITTGTGSATRDLAWLRARFRDHPDWDVDVRDVSYAGAVLALMGPRSREILADCCEEDVSDATLPFLGWREVGIAGHSVRAQRITYVGELGFELHCPVEVAGAIYDRLMRSGSSRGLINAGYRAIESLRLEKAYRAWGSDVTPLDTPLEAGLGFATKLDTERGFLGREALLRQRAAGLSRRLAVVSAALPQELRLLGRETLLRDGEAVGWLTSGGYGHTLDCAIGLGYVAREEGVVDAGWLRDDRFAIEVAGERFPARLQLRPLFDPANQRVRG